MRHLALYFVTLALAPTLTLAEEPSSTKSIQKVSGAIAESTVPEERTSRTTPPQPDSTTPFIQPRISEHPTADTLIPDQLRELVSRPSPHS